MSDSVIPWTVTHQAPLSMGLSRQEYWSGLPFPSPRDLLNPGLEPTSPILAGTFFITEPLGKPNILNIPNFNYNFSFLRFTWKELTKFLNQKSGKNIGVQLRSMGKGKSEKLDVV